MSTQESNEQLVRAARAGDVEGARQAMQGGANPDTIDADTSLTVVMLAACQGNAALVRLLLEENAGVHAIDARAGASALHKACQAGSLDCVKLLVAAGANINLQCATTGHTPLVEALWFKHVAVVAYLLQLPTRLALRTSYGFTLTDHLNFLQKVNVKGREEIEKLKERVAARQAADDEAQRKQVLMAATIEGDTAKVQALLAAGAEVDERWPMVEGFNADHTPLLVASREGHTAIVQLLVDAGADVNAMEPTFGAVPLHKGTYNGHTQIVRILAGQPGIDLDVPGQANGYTPLHDALWHGYEECSRILVEAGARLDLPGHDGLRPLDLAEQVFGPDDPLTVFIRARMQDKEKAS